MSSIEWTDETWNTVRGCTRISPGCVHCYAERMAARNLPGMKSPTTGAPFAIMEPSGPRWTGKVEVIESKLSEPSTWRKPRMVFVNSMSDLFHESLSLNDIHRVFARMYVSNEHTYQVLTKRSERLPVFMEYLQARGWIDYGIDRATVENWLRIPAPHIWLGVSVENRDYLHRIDDLRRTPAAVRFVSFEPLLGDIGDMDLTGIHWAIIGGESGPGARQCSVEWIRSLVRTCKAQGVKIFVKQFGAKPTLTHLQSFSEVRYPSKDRNGGDMAEWPEDLRVREYPR